MRLSALCVVGLLAFTAAASAQSEDKKPAAAPEEKPAAQAPSKHDTVSVSVEAIPGKNQVRVDVFVVNVEPVAGLPMPFRVSTKDMKLKFDSVSYAAGRVEYFQLKSQNADTANQTVLLGLIADLSGSKPPLAPGRGRALSLFYSGAGPFKADQVTVEPVLLAPANRLEFNTLESDGSVGSTIPTFVHAKAAKAVPPPKQ
jgi:hypothetical protein